MNWLCWADFLSAAAVSGALNSLWAGMLLVALAAVVLRLLPRTNAATRYAVWFTALLLILAMPAVLLIPRHSPAVTAVVASVEVRPAPLAIPVTASWPVYLALGWLAITALLLARIGWSLAHIIRLKRRAAPLCMRDNYHVLASEDIQVPMAAGFLRRAILFPKALVNDLTSGEFEQVLCHEIAHLRRWDDWTQLIQALAQAVLFFNPAVYWIGRSLKIEREMACDDWVVSQTGEARPYAACLTHLHELTRRASAPQLAPGASTRRRRLISARVEALLRPDRSSTPRFSRSGWIAAGAMASAVLLLAAKTVPPVGVQELPVSVMAFARIAPPAAPAIALTSLAPRHVTYFRPPRTLASRMTAPQLPMPPDLAASVMVVSAWQVQASPTYYIITVVFFEPPPPTVLSGT